MRALALGLQQRHDPPAEPLDHPRISTRAVDRCCSMRQRRAEFQRLENTVLLAMLIVRTPKTCGLRLSGICLEPDHVLCLRGQLCYFFGSLELVIVVGRRQ